MSDSDRSERAALVALGLILFAICFVAFFEIVARHINTDNSGSGFDPWQDGYAQWLMAFFALLATSTSVWAVLLLKDTLEQTRLANGAASKAANESASANLIMLQTFNMERRPLISLDISVYDKVARYRPITKEIQTNFLVQVTNHGRSPAEYFIMTASYLPDFVDLDELEPAKSLRSSFSQHPLKQIVFPNVSNIPVTYSIQNKIYNTRAMMIPPEAADGKILTFVMGNIAVTVLYKLHGDNSLYETRRCFSWNVRVDNEIFKSGNEWEEQFMMHEIYGQKAT